MGTTKDPPPLAGAFNGFVGGFDYPAPKRVRSFAIVRLTFSNDGHFAALMTGAIHSGMWDLGAESGLSLRWAAFKKYRQRLGRAYSSLTHDHGDLSGPTAYAILPGT